MYMVKRRRHYDQHPQLSIEMSGTPPELPVQRSENPGREEIAEAKMGGFPVIRAYEEPESHASEKTDDYGLPAKLTPHERLAIVRSEGGFFAHSARELNLALGAIENSDPKRGGFGRYLNEVLIHQSKSISDDPPAALRSIVNEIKQFAQDSRGSASMAALLRRELPDGQLTALDKSDSLRGWRQQGSTGRGLKVVARRSRLARMDQDEAPDYTVSSEDIEAMLETMRRYEAEASIGSIIEEERYRFDFWVETLKSAQSHMAVTAMVRSAIKSLNI